jgi:hypothetical protein
MAAQLVRKKELGKDEHTKEHDWLRCCPSFGTMLHWIEEQMKKQ